MFTNQSFALQIVAKLPCYCFGLFDVVTDSCWKLKVELICNLFNLWNQIFLVVGVACG